MNFVHHNSRTEHLLQIAYFSNHFAVRNGHGIARYAHQLLASLRRVRPAFNIVPVAAWSDYDEEGKTHLARTYGLRLLPWGRRVTPAIWTLADWPPIEHWLDTPLELVHAVSLGYPIATRKPYVVTVHDIGPVTHPEFFSNTRPWIITRSLQQAINKADALICVSQATADELASYAGGCIADRLHVIHEGVSPFFFKKTDPACLTGLSGLPAPNIPFILTAGKISPRKNVTRVIRAFSKLIDKIPHHLLLVGGNGWEMEKVLKEIEHSTIVERVHLVGYVSDEQLHALYASANVYIHPSLYEGFGLPILEAMAAGCPVVTSNISSLPEVAGDAALLIDPYNVDVLAEAIEALCLHEDLAANLTQRGRARAKNFTWERCAEQVAEVYDYAT